MTSPRHFLTLEDFTEDQLRAMLSPDPAMGKRGYPLLLASGETADGTTPLVDRQRPEIGRAHV